MTVDLEKKYGTIKRVNEDAQKMVELLTEQQECETLVSASANSKELDEHWRYKAGDKADKWRVRSCVLSVLFYIALHVVGYIMQQKLELIVTAVIQLVLAAIALWSLYRIVDEGEGWGGFLICGIIDIPASVYFASYNLGVGVGVFSYLSAASLYVVVATCILSFVFPNEKYFYNRIQNDPQNRALMEEALREDREDAEEGKKRLKAISVSLKSYSLLREALEQCVAQARSEGIPALPGDDVEVMRRMVKLMPRFCELADAAQLPGAPEDMKLRYSWTPNSFVQDVYEKFCRKQEELQASTEHAQELVHSILKYK